MRKTARRGEGHTVSGYMHRRPAPSLARPRELFAKCLTSARRVTKKNENAASPNAARDKNRYPSTMDTTTGEIGRAAAIEVRLFGPQRQGAVSTPALISAMLDSGKGINDLIFSPRRQPQVERHGELVPVPVSGAECLTTDDTARIPRDLI